MRSLSRFAHAVLLVALSATPALAQRSSVAGRVLDASEAVIVGAGVTLVNDVTHSRQQARTNDAGLYEFPVVQPGTYTLLVQASGFKPHQQTNVVVDASRRVTVNLKLEVGNLSESVDVAGRADGSAAAGYRVGEVKQLGPWGELPLQDTPYSMTVMSEEFIQNTINGSTDHFWDLVPNVFAGRTVDYQRGSSGTTTPVSRGLNMTGLVNGVRMAAGASGYFLEEMERVEVNTGLTGFLYGGGYIGGSTNFVTKRPTARRQTSFTFANTGGENYTGHLDTSGPIPGTSLGYRVNLMYGGGEMAIRDVHPKKELVSGALDWHVTKTLLVQFDAAYRGYRRHGQTTDFPNALGGRMVEPLDPSYSYMPDWMYSTFSTKKAGANLEWKPSGAFSVRGAYRWESTSNDFQYANPSGADANGNFTMGMDWWRTKPVQQGTYIYADTAFRTGSITHKVTAGPSYNQQNTRVPNPWSLYIANIGSANYYVPESWNLIPVPDRTGLPTHGTQFNMRTTNRNLNLAVGDEVGLSDKYSLMLGYVYTHVYLKNYAFGTGVFSGRPGDQYDEGTGSYTASFVYKPVTTWTLYTTAIQATEAGTYVAFDATPRYANAGDYLPPTTSTQYEVGAKRDLKGLLLSMSVFYIDRANFLDVPNADGTRARTQDGRQEHRGVELSAMGKGPGRITAVAGATLYDAKVVKGDRVTWEGHSVGNIPYLTLHSYLEYQPVAAKPLYVTGALRYIGKMYYWDFVNYDQPQMPSATVGELGLRYTTRLNRVDTSFRLNIQNISNEWYWRTSNYGMLGDPRAVTFSVTTQF